MNNNAMVEKKQYGMIDIAKFLCALFILFYHYFSENGPVFWLLDEALSLYAVAVALFMIMSGFLTYKKLSTIEDSSKRWSIVKKQVLRILKIYLIWSIPYIIYQICRWDFANIDFEFIVWELQRWIFNSTFYTIWFMPSLAIGTLLSFWLMEKLLKKAVYILAIALYVIGSLQLTYSFVLEAIPFGKTFIAFSETWLGGARGWLFFSFPLITLGGVMVKFENEVKTISAAIASVASVGLLLGEGLILRYFEDNTGIDLCLMMPIVVICILCFLISVNIKSGSLFIWMRKMSVLLFVSQRLFLTVLIDCLPSSICSFIFSNVYFGAVILCGITIGFCAFIIALSSKVKWLKKLY